MYQVRAEVSLRQSAWLCERDPFLLSWRSGRWLGHSSGPWTREPKGLRADRLGPERPWYGRDWSDPLDGRGDSLRWPIAFPKHPVAAILVGLLRQRSGRHRAVDFFCGSPANSLVLEIRLI